jgi:hypothetical protein
MTPGGGEASSVADHVVRRPKPFTEADVHGSPRSRHSRP